ncbi:TonB-dependent siderophore receptor PiuA [Bowmanella denitrificans]|uniref:TonB-dependent siderophore receptor PiuA n=1 Tax=Bowmanella denitrificans TaxID=366582 RepID=A0ABN0X6E4_9ALTE
MSNRTHTPYGSATSLLALSVAAAFSSQTLAADQSEIKELPTAQATVQQQDSYQVTRSSSVKFTQPLLDTAKSITVIPESVMKDRGVDSLRDALRSVSGISLAAGEGGAPSGDSMAIRGFSASNDIFVDGIRDIAGYYRDTYNLESVEVAKGPGSAVTGRGATGGSINLQSKTARLDQFTDVSARGGSEQDYRATVDTNMQVGDTSALRVNLLAQDGELAGRDEVENATYAGALSYAAGLGTDKRFNANLEYQKQDNLPDYGLPWVGTNPVAELADYVNQAPPVDFDNFYGNVNRDQEDIKSQSVTLRYEQDLSAHSLLRIQARAGEVKRQTIVTAPRFYKLAESTDVRLSDEKTRDSKNSLKALQADWIANLQSGGIRHDLVVGVELARETFKRWNMTDVVDDNLDSGPALNDLYHPNPHLPFTGRYERDGTSIEADADTLAIYAFDTVTINPQWQVTGGLRWESFDSDYQYDYSDPSKVINTDDNMLAWNLSAVFKPADNGSIYLAAGNSYNPSAEGIAVSTRRNEAELDPEQTRSIELGTKWNLLDDKLLTSAALFRSVKNNARLLNDDSMYELNGEHKVQGIELSATGVISKQWNIIGSFSYQDSEDVSTGNELPNTPKQSFSLWTTYQFNDALNGGFGAQYVGKRYNNSSENRRTGDDYVLLDVMLSYRVNEQLRLQFNGENLTDEEYLEQLGGGHAIPGVGRYFTLGAHYSF